MALIGLLPDVLKCCGGPLLYYILTLFQTVWEKRCVPSELRGALLVPVLKKGDLSCDNCRGISLLDVMGKLFTRVSSYLMIDYSWWYMYRRSSL